MSRYAVMGFLGGSVGSIFMLKTGYRKYVSWVNALSWSEVVGEWPGVVVMSLIGALFCAILSAPWAKDKKDEDNEEKE
jgi:hypothetical protein